MRPSQFPFSRVTGKVKVYRNGDHVSYPVSYSYDSARVSSLKELLRDLQTSSLSDDGARVTRLYTVEGRRIGSTREFENAGVTDFVATGPEGFMRIKGGYQSHPAYKGKHEENNNGVSDRFYYRSQNAGHRLPSLRRSTSMEHVVVAEHEFAYPEGGAKLFGNTRRRFEDRINNGIIKKIYLYRNGDPYFKPKLYVYRSKIHRKWEKFLEDLETVVPPIRGGGVRRVYTLSGKEVKSLDHLQHRRAYVVAGPERFSDVRGGYHSIGKLERASSSAPQVNSRPQTGRQSRLLAGLRWGRERLHERRLPEPIFFFVFKNGDGLSAKRFLFTPQQFEKGKAWILEQVGRRFGIYAHKLVTMDNREITDTRQIINRGAYIVIPFGEKFTDNWHHFPEMAIDTSHRGHSLDRRPNYGQGYGSSSSSLQNQSRLSRSYSSLPPLPNAGYGRETNSYDGRDAYSDVERDALEDNRSGQESDDYRRESRRSRSASGSSQCSLCEMFERHRREHHSRADIKNEKPYASHFGFNSSDPSPPGSQKHIYSAEDIDNLLPPRPVTSRRVRLSHNEVPTDNEYPVTRATVDGMLRPSLDHINGRFPDDGEAAVAQQHETEPSTSRSDSR